MNGYVSAHNYYSSLVCLVALKVSDRLLCNIVAGFIDECREADPDVAETLQSSKLLQKLSKASKTRHENRSGEAFEAAGLAAPVPIHMKDVGAKFQHPILKVTDFLQAFATHRKLPLLWGSKTYSSRTEILPKFWRRFKAHDPQHPVFQIHAKQLAQVLPLQIHSDEGQTLKKTGVMVISWQSPLGFGTTMQDDSPEAMCLNFIGNSYSTRFLFTVCTKKSYRKKTAFVLDRIFEVLVDELHSLFHEGVLLTIGGEEMRFFIATIGMKGDWPIHARVGHLTRHFARKGVYKESATSGFCHLCRAGETDYPAFDFSAGAAWRGSYLTSTPWAGEGGPLCKLPQSPKKEFMHKFDCFHTCHKGIFAELAGSAIAKASFAQRVDPNHKPLTSIDPNKTLQILHKPHMSPV